MIRLIPEFCPNCAVKEKSYPVIHDKHFSPMDPGEAYVIDTTSLDLSSFGSKKSIVILNMVDHFSKFLYSFIVAGKTGAEVARCLREVCN
jgi:hypothetical protein